MKASKPSALRRSLSVVGKLLAGTRKGPSGDRVRKLKKLERKIGVKFTDLGLLEQALTHRSYSHVTSQTRNQSNERMEFLGDSVLGLAVSQFLYLQFPDRSEGALSKMKSLLVSRKVLSAVARDAGVGEFLLLSGEESEMGGRDRSSILADSFEGVIGAIYLDQGFRAANKFIQRFLLGNIHQILKDEGHTNYKSLLQEYVQSKRLSHPVYRVRREQGPEHEKEFAIEVVVKGEVWGVGRGKSKKDAEQHAARAALEQRQGREAASRRRVPVESPRAERTVRSRTESSVPGVERRRRDRREAREPREPQETAPRDRGDHGILASREKLRSSRREEAEQRRREEREYRERAGSRGRPADAARPAEEPRRRRERRGGAPAGEGRRGSREALRARPPAPPAEAAAEEPASPPPPEDAMAAPSAGAVETPPERGFGRRRRSRRGPGAGRPASSPSAEREVEPEAAPEPGPVAGPPEDAGEEAAARETGETEEESAGISRGSVGFSRRKRRHVRGLRRR